MQFVFLGIYALILVGISVISVRRVKSLDDFHLGGRNIGPWLTAMAYGTTYFSAVIFVGYAGKLGWNFGLAAAWIGIGNALIGTYLPWKLLAKKTRTLTRELNVTTMPEFFNRRYQSKSMKIVSALVIFIFLTPYCASVYQGLAYMFEQVFGLSFGWCMLIMAVLTTVYLICGGYFATALTDFVQGFVMLIGIVGMLFYFFKGQGGIMQAVAKLESFDPLRVTLLGAQPMDLLWMVLLTSLGVWGLPQMVHKFYAIRSESAIKQGTIISTVFSLIVGTVAYLMGAFGPAVLGAMPVDSASGLPNPDMVVPSMLIKLMPNAMLGLIVILLLSASMSTLASLVLVSSSAISMDLIRDTFLPKMSEKKTKLCMQVLFVIFVAISLWIAQNKTTSIVNLMGFSWGTVAGVCIGPFVWGVLWKKTNRTGAWVGIISALLITAVFAFLPGYGVARSPFIGVMAMLSSLILTPLVSLLTGRKETPNGN